MAEATVEIVNKKGLHARAAAKFVKTVAAYKAQVTVQKLGEESDAHVNGGSILGLMMLGADPGSQLHLSASGEQAGELIKALGELVANKFGEGE